MRSFTLADSPQPETKRRKVLITGAAGRIGSHLAATLPNRYELRLMVRDDAEKQRLATDLDNNADIVVCDLSDLPGLKSACRDIDTVVHLAANPDPNGTWSQLLGPNIVGVYHLMTAAKSAGCRRVVYASSIHAVVAYPRGSQVPTDVPVAPGDLYGVTKCFGEALGRYMAEREGLSVIALRIGAWVPEEKLDERSVSIMDGWVSPRDLQQMIERCIDDETLQWAVFNALSGSAFNRLDLSDSKELVGYQPADEISHVLPQIAKLKLAEAMVDPKNSNEHFESGLREDV